MEKPENGSGAGGARFVGPYRRHIDLASKAVASFNRPVGGRGGQRQLPSEVPPFVAQFADCKGCHKA